LVGTILGVLFAIFLIFLVGQALWGPLRLLLRLLFRVALGGLALVLINLAAYSSGWSLGLNPASAALVGVLGVPGLLLLGAFKLLFPFH
jgi:inhibitor of the pro-sigma K processing machinery